MYQAQNWSELRKSRKILRSRTSWTNVGSNVLMLGITSLLTDVSSEMVTATLPIYLLLTLGFSSFQIGLIDGIYRGAAVLTGVLGGIASDRWRRSKQIATLGYGLSAICKLGFLVAGSSWTAISSVILVDRIGKGIRTAPRDAMIASSAPRSQLATAFGVHRAMDTAGAMMGPLFAVAVLAIAPQAYDAVFIVSLCIAMVGVAVIALFVDGSSDRNSEKPDLVRKADVSWRSIGVLLAEARFRNLMVAGSALAVVTVSDGLLYLALRQRVVMVNAFFPMLYVLTAFSFMTLAIPAGRLADRIGAKAVFILGHVMLAAVYGILLLPTFHQSVALLMLLLLGAYYAATDGVLAALTGKILPGELRATGLSVLNTGTALGRLLASILYGFIWSQVGARGALMIFEVGLAATVVVAWLMIRRIE